MDPGQDLSGSTRETRKSRLEWALNLPGWVYILCALGGLATALGLALTR
jgi:hypothetical protein